MPDAYSNHPTDFSPQAPASGDSGGSTPNQASLSREHVALPLRDWILLPLVAVVTLAALGGSVKLLADREVGERKALASSACILNQGAALHGVPNSACTIKYSFGQTVEYKFNSCGDRTAADCAAKPVGVYRIVLIGSSNPMGFGVSARDSLAERLSVDLSRRTGRRIEVYNASMLGSGGVPGTLAKRMPEILELQPDLILWVINVWDISFRAGDDGEAPAALLGRAGPLEQFSHTRAALYLRNYLFQSQSIYLAAYLKRTERIALANRNANNGDAEQFNQFRQNLGTIVRQANSAGAPVVATFLPVRGESASFFMSPRPASVDVDRFTDNLRGTLATRGVIYLDVVPRLLSEPALDGLYDRIGDHLNAEGHAAYAQILANALTGGAVPALSNNVPAQSEKMLQK